MEEEKTIVEAIDTPARSGGDGIPRETGKSSEVENTAESEKEEDGPWNELDNSKGHLVALQSGFMSDLTIIVQEETFRCHAYILGMASPKLAKMIKTNHQELQLSGVESTNFRILLEIMYSGSANELSTNIAKTLHVRRTAMNLQVYKAVVYCTKLIRGQIDALCVCYVLDEALLMNDDELKECGAKVVQEQTDLVLKSDGFLKCSVATLEFILKQDVVHNVTERELFLALACWSLIQEKPREILETSLSLIRFHANKSTATNAYFSTLMNNVERNLSQYFVAKNKMPEGFSNEKSNRKTTWSVARYCPGMEETITLNYNYSDRYRIPEQQLAMQPLRILVNEDVFLIGVIALSNRFNVCYSDTIKYTEDANLTLKDENGKLISTATFSGELKKSDEYQVKFPQPVALYAKTTYTLHLSNSYSEVRYYTTSIVQRRAYGSFNPTSTFHVLNDGETPIKKIIIAKIF